MKSRTYKLPYFLAGALFYLFEEGVPKTTTEIFDYLKESLGNQLKEEILSSEESDRKILVRALRILEDMNIIESKSGGGRKPVLWQVKDKFLKGIQFLSEEELYFYLLFFSFIPDDYKRLPLFKPVQKLLKYFSSKLDRKKIRIIEDAFGYEAPFVTRFAEPNAAVLKAVVKAILEEKPVKLIKDGKERTVFPVNLFFYEGNLYLGALKKKEKYGYEFRSYLLHSIDISTSNTNINFKVPESVILKNRKKHIGFLNEKPFIFGVELVSDFAKEIKKGGKVFSTQFFSDPKTNIVYLVGYTSPLFYSDFISKEFKRLIPPDDAMLAKARECGAAEFAAELYPHLPKASYDLKRNLKNFNLFKREMKNFLQKKLEKF